MVALAVAVGCRSEEGAGGDANGAPPAKKSREDRGGHGEGGSPFGRGGMGGSPDTAAVPVEVVEVTLDTISSFLETNGVLEAENEVDIVSRTSGPIVELAAEEGMRIAIGQLLVRIDDTEHRALVEIAKVELEEATRAHARAKASIENEIISQEVYDQALARLEAAKAQLNSAQVQYDYTTITAPFDGIVIERYVKFAENVSPNQQLFRISDFDPLLCKIQVPEKELSRLKKGQKAFLSVAAWPSERFEARVLRISPVVDASTGTIRVTLEVRTRGKLSPGMFASVLLETDTRSNTVVMPKRALSLESLTDTVFVVRDGMAMRRDLELGYEEDETVEVLSGLDAGDRVVAVGQDGLTNGTAVQILKGPGAKEAAPQRAGRRPEGKSTEPSGYRASAGHGVPPAGGGMGMGDGTGRPGMDFNNLTPEQLESIKKRMRDRGMSDEEIEEFIKRRREQARRP